MPLPMIIMEQKEQENIEVDKKEEKIPFLWQVPECCSSGFSDCPHVVQPIKKVYDQNLI